MENDQETRNMIGYVDDTSEKGRNSYLVKDDEKKTVQYISRKYSKPRLKMTPLVRFLLIARRHHLIILEDYIKL